MPAAIDIDVGGERHIVLRDSVEDRHIVLPSDLPSATPLAALVPLDADLPRRLEAVLRLWQRLTGRDPVPAIAPLTLQKRRRLILMLRALDARQHRATYRQIAAALVDSAAASQQRSEWQTSSYRARAIRLVRDAVRHMEGGYRDILRGR